MRKTKFPKIIYLLIGIPVSSLVTGVVLIVAAHQTGSTAIPDETSQLPLNKVSWRASANAPQLDPQRSGQDATNPAHQTIRAAIQVSTEEASTEKGAGE